MKKQRKCVGCGEIKNQSEMIRVMRENISGDVIIAPDSKKFGRSAYLCYNKTCIEASLKKNKLSKALKSPITEELKGQLIDFRKY